MAVLCIGDTCLPAKIHAAHGYAVGRIGMGSNHNAAGQIDHVVSSENIHRSTDRRRSIIQRLRRDGQVQEEMFNFADVLLRGEQANDVKAKSGSEFKAG